MHKSEIFISQELISLIEQVVQNSVSCEMSYISRGTWHITDVNILNLSNRSLTLRVSNDPRAAFIQINQPLGITFELDQQKCIFESKVIGFDTAISRGMSGNMLIQRPVSIERMQRRSYDRVPVPSEMKVETLFWHRGYTDNSAESPLINYWQGEMIDLSAGGTQIKVARAQHPNFREGQIIGIQFTPLPSEKPLLVEGRIKHIADLNSQEDIINLGIEFMGLEASADGRRKLERIINTVSVYRKQSVILC